MTALFREPSFPGFGGLPFSGRSRELTDIVSIYIYPVGENGNFRLRMGADTEKTADFFGRNESPSYLRSMKAKVAP